MAELLRAIQRSTLVDVRTAERAGHLLSGLHPKGETLAFPRRAMEQARDNWYRLIAYRELELVKAVLQLRGDENFSPAPVGIRLKNSRK